MRTFTCQQCSTIVEVTHSRDYRTKFCSQGCSATYTNLNRARRTGPKKNCLNCGVVCDNANAAKYCSESCSAAHRSSEIIRKWLSGEEDGSQKNGGLRPALRKYLLKEANYACTECGWDKINPVTGTSPLEIDHIDGDAFNNHPDNLKVLCPNCHSLTTTYKALNKSTRINRPTKI
jgi:5-methylcytosine-specific restriction endonuclease McrA